MGHLTLISEDVIAALALYPSDLSTALAQYCPQPQWDTYVSGRFKETKDRDSSQLGGGKPIVTAAQRPGLTSEAMATSAAREGVGLKVDEAERLPSLGATNSTAGKPRSPIQTVQFAAINEDDENDSRHRRTSSDPQTEEVYPQEFE